MRWSIAPEDRDRHVRLWSHVMVALVLAMIGRLALGFDFALTTGYGILAYLLLNVMNYRVLFVKRHPRPRSDEPRQD